MRATGSALAVLGALAALLLTGCRGQQAAAPTPPPATSAAATAGTKTAGTGTGTESGSATVTPGSGPADLDQVETALDRIERELDDAGQ